ncbi:hypothetical protein TNCT_102441 [Trichonephila clavata]|uniref:Uncharacterized protein n=1 Tax=Trichonephila clavata TaxID=2740835 RepID=A0A8X6GA94_TRICU|nr:hypothetical protein TNCT_102441 [Trichonephila clavata]
MVYEFGTVSNNSTQSAHRQQYGRSSWRSGQYQHPGDYSRNDVFSPQHPAFPSPQHPTRYPRNKRVLQPRPVAFRRDASKFHPIERTQKLHGIPTIPDIRTDGHQGKIQLQISCCPLRHRKCQHYFQTFHKKNEETTNCIEHIESKISTINGQMNVSEIIFLQIGIGEVHKILSSSS